MLDIPINEEIPVLSDIPGILLTKQIKILKVITKN